MLSRGCFLHSTTFPSQFCLAFAHLSHPGHFRGMFTLLETMGEPMPRHAALLIMCVLTAIHSSKGIYGSTQQASEPNGPRARANNDTTYLKLRNIHVGMERIAVSKFTL